MKRIIAVLMALMLVFCLSACKSSGSDISSHATASNTDISENANDITSSDTEVVSDTGTVPHDAVTEGEVIDAITYSKDVVPAKGVDPKEYENQMHVIAVPKIPQETANVKAFNDKIYNDAAEVYEKLKGNKEDKNVYNIGYEYKTCKDTIAIMVMNNCSVQGGSSQFIYKAYYYDLKRDKELTYKEYLKAVGLTQKKVQAAAEGTAQFGEMLSMASDKDKVYVKDCLVDEHSAMIFINNPNETDGWWRIDIGSVF